jgi:hypothetical protein
MAADWTTLLELLTDLDDTAVGSDEVLLYLQQFKGAFLKLLEYKVSVGGQASTIVACAGGTSRLARASPYRVLLQSPDGWCRAGVW